MTDSENSQISGEPSENVFAAFAFLSRCIEIYPRQYMPLMMQMYNKAVIQGILRFVGELKSTANRNRRAAHMPRNGALMHYNKVVICGVNTANLPSLTDEEKTELILRAKRWDSSARERLIGGNLRLVLSIIQRFTGRREGADDLFQVGCIGLIKAVDNFNTELDVKFSTYAVPMIIGELRRYLRDNNSIHVSRSVRDLAYRALQAKERLSLDLATEPSMRMIASEIGEKVEAVRQSLEAISEPVSLFEPVFNDGGDTLYLMDQLCDESGTDEKWLDDIALREAMKSLSERERTIVNMRYYGGKTQMEIASEIGISQAQVSRLEKGAFERLRRRM